MKSYCDKSTAKRGFIRMGGDAARFESVAKEVDGKWLVDDSALPKSLAKIKRIARPPRFASCNMPHKTGDALIAHIRAFDQSRGLRSGTRYIIGGREVVV